MILATPVRTSAWSSTTSTVAFAAATAELSAGDMDLCWKSGRFPGKDDLGTPARSGHDRQRRANALGPFVHARHSKTRRGAIADDAAAVVGNRQPQPQGLDRGRLDRDPPRARVSHGVRQGFLCDAENLAFHAIPESGQLVDDDINGDARGSLTEIREASQCRGDVFTGADVGTKGADRA